MIEIVEDRNIDHVEKEVVGDRPADCSDRRKYSLVSKCRSTIKRTETFIKKGVFQHKVQIIDKLKKLDNSFSVLDNELDDIYEKMVAEEEFDLEQFEIKRDEYESIYYYCKEFLEDILKNFESTNKTNNENVAFSNLPRENCNAKNNILNTGVDSEYNSDQEESIKLVRSNENIVCEKIEVEHNVTAENNHLMNVSQNANNNENKFCNNLNNEVLNNFFVQQNKLIETLLNQKAESQRSTTGNVKLPRLEIPKFKGDFTEWMAFRDLFLQSVDSNKSLSDSQKLQYLKTLVQGEASKLISHFSISDTNYVTAWNTLIETYDCKKFLMKSFIVQFNEMKKVSHEGSLWKFVNSAFQILDAVDNLGLYSKSPDPWIIHLLSEKIDNETIRLWNQESINIEAPSLNDFRRFLRQRCDTIELGRKNISVSERTVRSVQIKKNACLDCKKDHDLFNCTDFKEKSVLERKKFVESLNLCFNCLKKGHSVKKCYLKFKCRYCGLKHNSLLHDVNKFKDKEVSENKNPSLDMSSENSIHFTINKLVNETLLPTALVTVYSNDSVIKKCVAMLDTGAQVNLISEKLAKKLGCKIKPTKVKLKGISGEDSCFVKGTTNFTITPNFDRNVMIFVDAIVVKSNFGSIPKQPMEIGMKDFSEKFTLANSEFYLPNEIEILLGVNKFFEILKPGFYQCKQSSFWMVNSVLGWLICGGNQQEANGKVHFVSPNKIEKNIDDLLKKFWDIEENILQKDKSIDDCYLMDSFEKSIVKDNSGHYVVGLPFINKKPDLGDSFSITLKRFFQLEKKFASDSVFKKMYVEFMKDYLSCNHMSLIEKNEISKDCYFIPHHGILQSSQEKKKLRVVFDASCKSSNGKSLNDELLIGPNLQIEIFGLLLYLRMHRYILTTDIKQMYRQINVSPKDRNYQIVLWRENVSDPIQYLRLNTVTYGTKSAPFLAMGTLRYHAKTHKIKYPEIYEILTKRTYMDDIYVGSNSIDDLCKLKSQLVEMMNLGNFELKKWASNCKQIVLNIAKEDLAKESLIEFHIDENIKTLGITWKIVEDCFSFSIKLKEHKLNTKRTFLSDVSSIFDPMGWISPVIIRFKQLLQELWIRKINWDDELPKEILDDWLRLKSELFLLETVRIPRFVGSTKIFDIHGFADSSLKSYAAVIYLRTKINDNSFKVSLLASKTRVAPLKPVTIPRLELCAACLLSTLMKSVVESMELFNIKQYCWTDSEIVLAWLSKPPSNWKSFVSNRVADIHEKVPRASWLHIRSKDNPADCASRGVSPSQFVENQLWKNGPHCLSSEIVFKNHMESFKTDHDKKKLKILINTHQIETANFIDLLISRCSSFNKLINSFCYVRRFLCLKKDRVVGNLTLEEIKIATQKIIKFIQFKDFKEDITRLKSKGNVSSKSCLFSLTPFLDENKIMRIGGRLQNSNEKYDTKHPIVLKCCPFVDLLIRKEHLSNLHAGNRFIVNLLRQNYWIFNLRRRVKKILNKCIPCIKQKSKTFNQIMGPLPSQRTEKFRSFLKCGVDFAGPLSLRPYKGRGNITVKGYISVFICFSTKAVHLELVMSLDTSSFLCALDRFIARRGRVIEIWSDNGRNFLGASSYFKEITDLVQSSNFQQQVQKYSLSKNITWKFIPVASPNFGGLWESAVKLVKIHLKRSIGEQCLTIEEANTVLCRIESILNSRPISVVLDDPLDPLAITPGHFLVGEPIVTMPYELNNLTKISLGVRYKLLQNIINSFWEKWRIDYIQSLQRKSKWKNSNDNIKLNEVVIIKRNNEPVKNWNLGIITKLINGADGFVRAVELRTKNKISIENVRNLVPLNVEDQEPQQGGDC